ncbi:type IV conjugative transfer system lipoprotein TraV [Cronobacter sakazakii]|uniref:type IV conjugative transfer system lipoprotein TraV n=1 Tax=Cronobacter sakazakii TaxID=28141 RepID=UPI000BEA5005|nr:type IV conjugative transfer system lipoprotein TraV [Cronobacter sakazakii]ELY5945186.1 type IV conjugative transfer system lipoprotein TraV [Cronobacter turicensis]ELY7546246.1 type IV conjugative transfer system lipoprotein TraV [Cronobacter turicensis]PQV65592.1 type IV conjugative transfer system protein TraV [Cronobacter sakazakii]
MNKSIIGMLLCSVLTGCAGMNDEFDCNKTATDQCLTMTEANRLAAQGKSLDEIDKAVKKPAGETLPALSNSAPVVNPSRPLSVSATGPTAAKHIAPRPIYATTTGNSFITTHAPKQATTPAAQPIRSVSDAGQVPAQRVPDATQRLWIAPWVDTDDNFHQPSVVEFVKNKAHWEEGFRVISEGEE